jgi:hypothetical protein
VKLHIHKGINHDLPSDFCNFPYLPINNSDY